MNTQGSRLLYIDDDEGLRQLVRRAMERRGYQVELAASGEDGVARAGAERFDAIALDHYMPSQDGLQTLEQLHALPDSAPIVYVTGSDETRIAVGALKAGAADYVVKSVGEAFFDLLDNAIRQAMAQVRLRRAKEEAEAALRASNARLQTLLREVNHRVANSLQLVSAFVHMQAAAQSDPACRDTLEATQSRITAIGQVHRKLYTSDQLESVEMADYLAGLAHELEQSWSTPTGPRKLRLAVDDIRLATDAAVSLGVIINELVTNACKYAYGSGETGEVRISLTRLDAHQALLCVEDDGRGLGGHQDKKGTGLGTRLMDAMARSLGSRLEYDGTHSGVRVTLRVPMVIEAD